MKLYLLTFGVGVLVGVIYYALDVRSPAPPIVALVGLLGILLGEQMIPVAKQLFKGKGFVNACQATQATEHVLGQLPGKHSLHIKGEKNDNTSS